MTQQKFFLKKDELPQRFLYPEEFERIVNQNLIDLTPWHILSGELLKSKYEGLKQRYPNSSLVPFAQRQDNDDVACWKEEDPEKVFIVHDYASEGWEKRRTFSSFWDWFKSVVDDMSEF